MRPFISVPVNSFTSVHVKLMRSLYRRGMRETIRHAVRWLSAFVDGRRKRLIKKSIDEHYDQEHGVHTGGLVLVTDLDATGENVQYAVNYQPVFPQPFNEVMRQLPLEGGNFLFVDFGSGKGRALLLASEFPFMRIVGIEFSHKLHKAAEANWRQYRSCTQKCKEIELLCIDAVTYDIPLEPTVFFFYNPFSEPVMRKIAERINKSLQLMPRRIFVVYFNPQVVDLWSGIETLELFPICLPVWPEPFGTETVGVWASREAFRR